MEIEAFDCEDSAVFSDPAELLEAAEQRALDEYEANADRPAYRAISQGEYVRQRLRVMIETGEIA